MNPETAAFERYRQLYHKTNDPKQRQFALEQMARIRYLLVKQSDLTRVLVTDRKFAIAKQQYYAAWQRHIERQLTIEIAQPL